MKNENTEINWGKIEEGLKQGFFGTVELKQIVGKTQIRLYETNIADPDDNECGWECAEWYLVDDDGAETLVARCDGYTGVEKEIDDDDLRELLGHTVEQWEDELEETSRECFWEKVTSYNITGELIAAAKAAALEEAAENYKGEVAIWVTPNYYAGTLNAPTADYLREGDGYAYNDIKTFDSYADAQKHLNNDDGPYVCAHGEAGRPNYRIVKID